MIILIALVKLFGVNNVVSKMCRVIETTEARHGM